MYPCDPLLYKHAQSAPAKNCAITTMADLGDQCPSRAVILQQIHNLMRSRGKLALVAARKVVQHPHLPARRKSVRDDG